MFGYVWPNSTSALGFLSLYRYDLSLKVWSVVSVQGEIPIKRTFAEAAVYNDEMYVMYGAIIETSEIFDDIWKFNFTSQKWIFVSNVTGDSTIRPGFVQNGSTVYFLCGRNGTNIFRVLPRSCRPHTS
jgi:N-acetylneuraminic acid mutarotase